MFDSSLPDSEITPISYRRETKVATVSDKNNLNDLNSKEWVEFTKSWFIENPQARKKGLSLHPAKYPESMVKKFLRFFTKDHRGDVIFDPFLGTGSTLVSVDELNSEIGSNRVGVGIELNLKYAEMAKSRTSQNVICSDSLDYDLDKLPDFDFIITSPPYWNVLHKDSGHINKKRKQESVDVVYSVTFR